VKIVPQLQQPYRPSELASKREYAVKALDEYLMEAGLDGFQSVVLAGEVLSKVDTSLSIDAKGAEKARRKAYRKMKKLPFKLQRVH